MNVDLDLVELNEWLDGFLNFEREPNWRMLKLVTMGILCEKFQHPESACPCFHVAGSKGKGTIAANVAGILRKAGYKTGVYASPHVLHYVERVGTGEGPFAMEVYARAFAELKQGVEELFLEGELKKENVTWYELSTIFAMLCFREAGVDYAIYEVGMGGRLDATNIITPACCVFGPIELEHTKFLGNTLMEIAGEKAGIMKPGVPAVSVAQVAEVEKVLRDRAGEVGAEIVVLPKMGDYLKDDAEAAMAAVRKVLSEISGELMEQAVLEVKLPGRFELLSEVEGFAGIPYILLDVAHTPNSIKQVAKRMKKEKVGGKLLFACASDKNVEGIARILAKSDLFTEIYLTRPGGIKKTDLERVERAFRTAFADSRLEIVVDEDFTKFIPEVLNLANKQKCSVVVLGSFYLVGEVKKVLRIE